MTSDMMVSGVVPVFLCACFGGLLAELVKWYQLRESVRFPRYVRGPIYWIATLLMIVAGGGLAVLYGTEPRSALLVMHIGLSAPLIIKTLAETRAPLPTGSLPRIETPGRSMGRSGRSRDEPSLLTFLAGR